MQRELEGDNPEMLAAHILANIEDFFRIQPGSYEEKWDVDRESFCRKLWEMTPQELAQVADQVDQFWEASSQAISPAEDSFEIARDRRTSQRQSQ